MPAYRLYYFDGRGRGEAIRHMLKLVGQEFEDYRVGLDEWRSTLKKEMPVGFMPVLEIEEVAKIAGSQAILRYIANQHGLAGRTQLDKARLDMIGEVIQDLGSDPGPNSFGLVLLGGHPAYQGEEKQKEYFKTQIVPAIEKFAPYVEKFLLENGGNGLFLGDKETWVDVFAAEQFSKFLDFGDPHSLDAYPHIKELVARVHNHPIIRKHNQERKPVKA